MESSQSQQQRRGGGLILQTPPRSSDKAAARDLRSGEGNNNMSGKHDKEKGVNVQVILRCRSVKMSVVYFGVGYTFTKQTTAMY